MKRHNIDKSLRDILTAIEYIEDFLGPKRDYNVYLQNKLLQSGVERQLEITGEAINRILKIDPEIPIQSARKVVNLRNHVIHGYDKIENETIWAVVVRHLPPLKAEVERLLGEQ
jgi:uncharacterized protein with HEPN domain